MSFLKYCIICDEIDNIENNNIDEILNDLLKLNNGFEYPIDQEMEN